MSAKKSARPHSHSHSYGFIGVLGHPLWEIYWKVDTPSSRSRDLYWTNGYSRITTRAGVMRFCKRWGLVFKDQSKGFQQNNK